tara:strand:+ start:69 stop:680 length:612 start_codon:yes stop_codon:yes gene_type:complete
MNDNKSDREILEDCLRGDRQGWNALVERFSRYVYFLIQATAKRHGTTIDEPEAADLHNDFFVALLEDDYRRLRAFKGSNGCSIRSWLRVICIRRTIDSLRKRRRTLSLTKRDDDGTIELVDPTGDPLDQLMAQGQERRRSKLSELTDRLAAADRLLLELLYVHKLGATEIASTLRIQKGAVYTRKTRLIKRLHALAKESGLAD